MFSQFVTDFAGSRVGIARYDWGPSRGPSSPFVSYTSLVGLPTSPSSGTNKRWRWGNALTWPARPTPFGWAVPSGQTITFQAIYLERR